MFGIRTELGSATFSGFDEDGFPVCQFDGHGEAPGVEPAELHHPFGFVSRPRDPELDDNKQPKEGKSCNVFFGVDGDELHAWLGFDPRFIPNIPQLKKGGSAQYCAAGSFRVFDGDDGTETLYVPVPGGKAHVVTTGVDGNNDPYIGIEHADGMAVTMLHKSIVVKNAAGDAYIEINDSGINFNGNSKMVGGLLVGDVAAAQPVALAPALITLLNSLATALDASFGACTPPQPPKFVALMSPLTAALSSLLVKAT